jgi:hypothetical protein
MNTLYTIMATVPVADRRVLFHSLAPAAKSALWEIHLEKFAEGHDLSEEQRAVVADAIRLFNPGLYSIARDSPAWESQVHEPLRKFDEKAKAVFPRDLAIEAFAQLGPGDLNGVLVGSAPPGGGVTAQSAGLKPGLKPIPLMPSDCNCAVESDWCWGFSSCGGGQTCYLVTNDCGTGWTYDCNSRCHY